MTDAQDSTLHDEDATHDEDARHDEDAAHDEVRDPIVEPALHDDEGEDDGDARTAGGSELGITMLGLAVLLGFGSFGTWYSNPSQSGAGIARWQGPGWITLVMAIVIAVAATLGLAGSARGARVVAATMSGGALIVSGYFCIQFALWYPSALQVSIGWGLWLATSAGLVSLVFGSIWSLRGRAEPALAPSDG